MQVNVNNIEALKSFLATTVILISFLALIACQLIVLDYLNSSEIESSPTILTAEYTASNTSHVSF